MVFSQEYLVVGIHLFVVKVDAEGKEIHRVVARIEATDGLFERFDLTADSTQPDRFEALKGLKLGSKTTIAVSV